MAQSRHAGGFMSSVRRWLGAARPTGSRAPLPTEHGTASVGDADPRLQLMLAEWQEVRESLRFCDRQRLAQLAIFIVASMLVAIGFLATAVSPDAPRRAVHWALPALGAAVSLIFIALEAGALAYRREWARRGRQIETAVQVLLPGIGHVSSLALLSEFDPSTTVRVRLAIAAVSALYAVALAAWIATLLGMLVAR